MPEYKCVAAPTEIEITSKEDQQTGVRSFADIINREAKDGWIFFSMESITVTQKFGCLLAFIAPILRLSPPSEVLNMLIFVKE